MRILILGGGSVGGKLARELKVPFTLIESDPSRVFQLKMELADKKGDFQILHGDGSSRDDLERGGAQEADAAVVLMNKDVENLESALILREMGANRIIARVNDPQNMYRFIGIGAEVFLHPIGYEEGLIRTMLFPDIKHAVQIFVREDSPAIGKTIEGLRLPEGSVIGAVLRGDELLPADPRTEIHPGDLIAVDTVGKRAKEVWRIFSRKGSADITGHVLFPLLKDRDLAAVREAELLAKRMGSEMLFITRPDREDLLTSARGFISTRVKNSSVSLKGEELCVLDEGGDIGRPRLGRKRQKMALERIIEEHSREGSPHLDIVIIPGPRSKFFYSPFITNDLDRLIDRSPIPILISRCSKPYRNILIYLHGHRSFDIPYSIQICRATGASLTALYTPANRKKAQYMKRFAQVYKVDVSLKRVVGNPTVELIKEIKDKHYDMVILRKGLKEIQISQLRRIVHLWTGSVLVVPEEVDN